MRLLIVESSKKAKTIAKLLGPGFEVKACLGHVKDLPRDALGVELPSFQPLYVLNEDKGRVVEELKRAVRGATETLLATDPDREGEAIAWHLAQELRLPKPLKRVTFNEITAGALKAALAAPRALDMPLVDAQQARRVLDRLVGYQVSPLLGIFGRNHSAGRVQSATLHLVVQREKEREAFRKMPYWTLAAAYVNGLTGRYATVGEDGALADTRLGSEAEARAIAERAHGPHTVTALERAETRRSPKAPFKTSTLQQAASVAFRWSADKTMELAQHLYQLGLITYMRTDAVTLSQEAVQMARDFLARDYPEALPDTVPTYRSRADAQGAHEAIRPTSLDAPAADVGEEALQLYALIRARFLASQCRPALFDQTTVTLAAADTQWRARGSVLRFPSFLKYLRQDEDSEGAEAEAPALPAVKVGDVLEVTSVDVSARETQPPPRYTEATLVAALEHVGIGRPSTYASIVGQKGILFAREYFVRETARAVTYIVPTARGRLIDSMLELAFPDIVRADYTAQMERALDEVEAGKRAWKAELARWYEGFSASLLAAPSAFAVAAKTRPELQQLVPEAPRPSGKGCLRCGSEMLLCTGPHGAYLACSDKTGCGFRTSASAQSSLHACPVCGLAMEDVTNQDGRPYARCLERSCKGRVDLTPPPAETCPRCAGPMRDMGKFLGCAAYPKCKGTLDKKGLAKAQKADKRCPRCQRYLQERRKDDSKFWGCTGYPECRYTEAIAAKPARAPRAKGAA